MPWGATKLVAEIIPVEPDLVSASGGKAKQGR